MFEIEYYNDSLKRIDILIQNALEGVSINSNDRMQLFSSALFVKVRNGYEASKSLLDAKLFDEASYIVRTILETMFIIKYLRIDIDDTLNKLKLQHQYQVETTKYNCAVRNEYESLRSMLNIPKNNKYPKADRHKNTSILKWAKLSNSVEFYVFIYNWYCSIAHTSLTSLENLFIIKDEEIVGFKESSDEDDIHKLIYALQTVVIESIDVINEVFDRGLQDEINSICDLIKSQAETQLINNLS